MNNSILLPALLSLGLLLGGTATANNIQVTNASLTGNTGTSVKVQFDISWENSWRGGGVTNWDAAWVFVKFRSGPAAQWQHLRLSNAGHVAPAGSQIDPGLVSTAVAYNANSNPVVGVFVYRNAAGNGTFSLSGVQLLVDNAAAGVGYNDLAEIQVFAIEMVYVPEGPFHFDNSVGSYVLLVVTTDDPTITATPAYGYSEWSGGFPYNGTNPDPDWPNGYGAFYCMKYEVTQQGYVDFLNTLSYTGQSSCTTTSPNSPTGTGALSPSNANRNGIDIKTPGVVAPGTPAVYGCNLNGNGIFLEANDGRDIACNWLKWFDLERYLHWSGLRPMTEMEFVKACRGSSFPTFNELASGSNEVNTNPYTLANAGTSSEGIATNYSASVTNVNWSGSNGTINGPMRVGIFAANGSNSGRITSGASYYGIMEMSGNVHELVITALAESGRDFNGSHGDGYYEGVITTAGTWPGDGGYGVIEVGGSWNSTSTQLEVERGSYLVTTDRSSEYGGRGVRTAP